MSSISRMRCWWWMRPWLRSFYPCNRNHNNSTKRPHDYLKFLILLYIGALVLMLSLYWWSNRSVESPIVQSAPIVVSRQHNSRDSDTHGEGRRQKGPTTNSPPPMKSLLDALRKSLHFLANPAPPAPSIDATANDNRPFTYSIVNREGENLSIDGVLPMREGSAPLRERVVLGRKKPRKRTLLLMWDVSFSQGNLRGCPDWNCRVTSDHTLLEKADAVFFTSPSFREKRSSPSQYHIHYCQESPVHAPLFAGVSLGIGSASSLFNMSLSYRFDTPSASPYGYTAKLSKESRRSRKYMKRIERVVKGKSKGVAWFVSHCPTSSQREQIIDALKVNVKVDIYGSCGSLQCAKQSECEEALNTDYHFYFAAENSICTDYITEKLWNQGYSHWVVPIVLRRWVVEPYVPPHSFIAVDDYKSVKEMANHLDLLMENHTKYLEYFEWRRGYEVIVLDDKTHPSAERAWGFCQVCRLTQMEPRPVSIIHNMATFWDRSCEEDGEFARAFLGSQH